MGGSQGLSSRQRHERLPPDPGGRMQGAPHLRHHRTAGPRRDRQTHHPRHRDHQPPRSIVNRTSILTHTVSLTQNLSKQNHDTRRNHRRFRLCRRRVGQNSPQPPRRRTEVGPLPHRGRTAHCRRPPGTSRRDRHELLKHDRPEKHRRPLLLPPRRQNP